MDGYGRQLTQIANVRQERLYPGRARREVAIRGCQLNNCTAPIDTHAIDLGVDTVAGGKRDVAKLRDRAKSSVDRSDRG